MLLQIIFIVSGFGLLTNNYIKAQHVPYSLQSAVNALHRRENDLALRENYDEDYNDPTNFSPDRFNQQRKLNKLLAKYLRKEEEFDDTYDDFDEDNYLANEMRKRSFFRERDEKEETPQAGSNFREREFQPSISQKKLAEDFLREINEERELEEEEAYKEAIRGLWEKYQQQENEIENDLYGEQSKRFVVPSNEASGGTFVGPLMQKKQNLVLPWLPYSKKKRFPVAKRSPKMPLEPFSVPGENNKEKIAKDLEEIFGSVKDAKKKRSADIDAQTDALNSTEKIKEEHNSHHQPNADGSHHSIQVGGNKHHHRGPQTDHHGANKSDESHEVSHEDDGSEEHGGEEHEDESDEDAGEEGDEDERKKKRSVAEKEKRNAKSSSNKEILKEDQIIPGDLTNLRKKKSIDWSQYFGLNRKKKSNWKDVSKKLNAVKKRSSDNFDSRPDKPKKSILDEEKLNNMDTKLKSIEDLIIDETIKYTGAHEGITRPGEIRDVKDHVLSRLGTAYNLEKMRRALEKVRQTIENENHLQRNEIEDKMKRLSVKKESAPIDRVQHAELNDKTTESANKLNNNSSDDSESQEDKKKKKKRNGAGNIKLSDVLNDFADFDEDDGPGHFEPHNDVYLGRQNNGIFASQCPIIDAISDRCRNIEISNGDLNQELLPACGIHQLCYLCGSSQTACDLQYLSDSDGICDFNSDCKLVARTALLALRHSSAPQLLGTKECLKNPCLYRAMREIGL